MAHSFGSRPHGQQARLRRERKFSTRAFYLSILIIATLTVFSYLSHKENGDALENPRLRTRSVPPENENEECRLVHNAEDKCAFVRANCFDEEAGLFSYLTFYYCRLPHLKPVAFAVLVLWLALLFSTIGIAASDFFCVNLSTIAGILGMSETLTGVTFLAFGNGSPDVFSTFAAMNSHSGSLAVGELIGAAGFITAVVAGSMAIVRPFKVVKRSFVRDVGFFIIASSFSIYFLQDGRLQLWECIIMVAFYVFYVITVVMWHWWENKRRRAREIEAAARSHYLAPALDDVDEQGPYHDDEDDDGNDRNMSQRGRTSRGISIDDFSALERGNPNERETEVAEDEETRDKWLAEISSNMRLSRPVLGERRHTQNPIRPSLVGALEFRAVLASLQKSRNIQSMPINLRRYSDDPTFTTAQATDQLSTVSDPAARPPQNFLDTTEPDWPSVSRPALGPGVAAHRARAISANGTDMLQYEPRTAREIDLLGPISDPRRNITHSPDRLHQDGALSKTSRMDPHSSSLSPTLHPLHQRSRSSGPSGRATRKLYHDADLNLDPLLSPNQDQSRLAHANGRNLPKLSIPGPAMGQRSSTPTSPFPQYYDRSPSTATSSLHPGLHLPPPSTSPESFFPEHFTDEEGKPPSWWPSKLLPTPQALTSALFPTLYNWREKNWWERVLGIIAAPSVFVLAVTLPVIEYDDDDNTNINRTAPPTIGIQSPSSSQESGSQPKPLVAIFGPEDAQDSALPNGPNPNKRLNPDPGSESTIVDSQQSLPPSQPYSNNHPAQPDVTTNARKPKNWNRWLVILQAFTAPLFIVIIVWANTSPASASSLLLPCLYALLASLVILAIIIGTTTPERPPRWHMLLCFAGFAVSITWISTIAGEVVGVLKTLGVILNMSDAILGLTIFAVGNSLGDLVADITVARLGYPVMALSACFGGPMLNILLGIGISGLYITIRGAQHKHRKHPDRGVTYKPYHIEVSNTLLLSGVSLLVTLVALLIFVPLRKWRMDRWIGFGLVALWSVSTIGNVVLEIVGWGKRFG